MEGIVFIGLQASGKSTFYKSYFFNTHVRLSMDMLNTRRKEAILLKTVLDLQQRFVIDNTNPTREERAKYIHQIKANKYKTIGYYFQSNLESCLKRNELRTGKEKIPKVGLYSTLKRLQQPIKSEGFDELYFVEIKDGEFKIREYKDEI